MFGVVYRFMYPILFLLSLPSWLLKTKKRGGFGTGITQRFGYFGKKDKPVLKDSIYVHAVSVGETLVALKIINKWRELYPQETFVLSVSTPTAHAVAIAQLSEEHSLIYSPFDITFIVKKVLTKYAPRKILLIESELWYNFLRIAKKLNIPVYLANARLSERSESRYQKMPFAIMPIVPLLQKVFVPYEEDLKRWQGIGFSRNQLKYTGSIKFDNNIETLTPVNEQKVSLLQSIVKGKKIIILASTSPQEEKYLMELIKPISKQWFAVIVPRHVERLEQVKSDLSKIDIKPYVYSENAPLTGDYDSLLVDTTGELKEWYRLADVALIGKSWLGKGGQNPVEPLQASIPTIVGSNMQNFEPLISQLVKTKGVKQVINHAELPNVINEFFQRSKQTKGVENALSIVSKHRLATEKTIQLIEGEEEKMNTFF